MVAPAPELPHLILRMRPDESVVVSRTDHPWTMEFPSLETGLEYALRQTRSLPGRIIVYDLRGYPIIRT